MVGEALTYKLLKFKKLVTRAPTYPHDVVIRSDVIVLTSDQRWSPPFVVGSFRNWYYGADWRIILVPGSIKFELALNGHIEREGIEL